MDMYPLKKLTVSILMVLPLFIQVNSAVVHSHSSNLNKERQEDGSFIRRDHGHLSNSHEHDTEFDHESIIGSTKEAEEYDQLSPEEAKLRLGILLTKMDLNGDALINPKELKSWILRSFKMLSQEEAEEHLEDVDENHDGKVTWEEYVADTYGSSFHVDGEDENQQYLKDDKALWKAADLNGDDVLEGDEWVAFSHPEEHPHLIPLVVQQTLRDKDTDKDGNISFEEYIGERGQDHDKQWLASEKTKFDSEFDKNGDSVLTGHEILSWVIPSNEEIADEEVHHLFASSDDDEDGILSFSEILNHHDIFVGSEATDYGDQLHEIHKFQDEL